MLRQLRYIEKDSQVPCLSTKPPWPALACERFSLSNKTACIGVGTRLTGTAADLHPYHTCAQESIHVIVSIFWVLNKVVPCRMTLKQCPGRVRVGVVMRSYI